MRWLRQNLKDRWSRALTHPGYTARALLHDLLGVDERFLACVTNTSVDRIRTLLNEPSGNREFLGYLRECQTVLRSAAQPGNDLFAKKILLQYALVRAFAPDIIVETGVANGSSSAYLLLACRLNRKGHLYSIDLNRGEFLPPGKSIGWIVPEHLRAGWTLILGDARKELPPLLADLGTIDMFIHDSDHSYEHMKFEFQRSYPVLRPGGFLLSDDANFNPAFEEHVAQVHPTAARVIRNVGIIRK